MKKGLKIACAVLPLLAGSSQAELLYSQPFYNNTVNRHMQGYGWETMNETTTGVVVNATFTNRTAIGVGRGDGAEPNVDPVNAVWPDGVTENTRGYPYFSTAHAEFGDYPTDSSCLISTVAPVLVPVAGLEKLSLEQRADNTDSIIRFAIKIGSQWYASAEEFGGQNAEWTLKEMAEADFSDVTKWVQIEITATEINLGSAPASPLSGTIAAFGLFLNTGVNPTPGDHVRIDNFQVYGTEVPPEEFYYIAGAPTDWTDAAAWDSGNAATNGAIYYATNSVVLNTPATASTFPGLSLNLVAPQRMDIMAGGGDAITVGDLTLDGAELGAGAAVAGEAQMDGAITLLSSSTFSGATDNSRNLRILSKVTGDAGVALALDAPAQTIYIDNAANDFAGTWSVAGGTGVFANAEAVDLADIEVQSGGALRIASAWDGYEIGASLTVADSATASVDIGSYKWTVSNLVFGATVVTNGKYDATALNALGSNPVFTGSGTLRVGPKVLLTGRVAHWMLDDASGTTALDSSGNDYDGTLIHGVVWTNDIERGTCAYFDGTDDRISTPFTYALASTNSFSWAFWANSATASNNNGIIVGNRYPERTTPDPKYGFIKLMPNEAQFANTGTAAEISHYDYEDISTNGWHHYAMVKSGTDYQWYVDGVAQGDSVNLSYTEDSGIPFNIGGDDNDGTAGGKEGEHFNGLIDDVVLYDYALSSNAVQNVMNGFYGSEPPAMTLDKSGGDLVVSWDQLGFKLQTRPNLAIGDWVDYEGGTEAPVIVPATNDVEFLRLIQQ